MSRSCPAPDRRTPVRLPFAVGRGAPVVITREIDPPRILLEGEVEDHHLDELTVLLRTAEPAGGDVRVSLRGVAFLQAEVVRTLVRTAGELADRDLTLVLDLAPHHRWAITALGWNDAPGLVMVNGDNPP